MLEKRLAHLEGVIAVHGRRLQDGDVTINQMRLDLAENTAVTRRIDSSTADLVDFFESTKGAFRVLNWIGKLARPIGAIIALFVAMWTAWIAYRGAGGPLK